MAACGDGLAVELPPQATSKIAAVPSMVSGLSPRTAVTLSRTARSIRGKCHLVSNPHADQADRRFQYQWASYHPPYAGFG